MEKETELNFFEVILKQESELEIYKSAINDLREITKIQCSDGNWNYDSYMYGMANGLILALSLFEGYTPEFLKKPKEWLCDNPGYHELGCENFS